ncbi:MAG: tetratricopeptide repeat protein [Bacteroidales bacterium]|nr:tetratricopeptide repeat protein [Bacteroidales bacterium]
MYRRILLAAAIAAFCSASAQVNSPQAEGWMLRARLMLADDNYQGCIDQIAAAMELPLTSAERQEAEYLRASAAVHTDKALARQWLEDFLIAYPASLHHADALMDLGDCYYGTDNLQALNLYLQIDPTEISPSRSETLTYRKAYCYMQLEFYNEAQSELDKLSRSPEYAAAAEFYRGYIAYKQGRYADARTLLENSRSTTAPGNMADYYLSQIYYMQGNYRNALSTSRAMLQLAKKSQLDANLVAECERIAGESSYRLGDKAEAQQYLESYMSHATSPLPSAQYILGVMAYNRGNYAKAVDLLRPSTIAGDAMTQSAYLYIGQALLNQGDIDGAILAFDNALNMDFDPTVQETAYFNYAVTSLQGGKVPFGNSVGTFENFLRKFPNSQYAPQAQQYIVSAYLNNNNYAAALKSINAMTNPTPETYRAKQRVLYMLGAQALSAGQAAQAINYLTQAKQLSTYDSDIDREVTLLLGEAYYRGGDYAKATQLLKQYVNSASTSQNLALAYYDLGYAQFAQKKYSDAVSSFDRMLSTPNALSSAILADAYARLGDCHYYLRQFAQAAEDYDKSYGLNPEVGDYALMQKALMEGFQRRHTQKIALLDQLQTQFPQSALIPDALLEKTESYIQLGNNQGAIRVYQELVRKYPNTSQGRQGFLQMALTMLNAGQKDEAIEAYKQVITLYPSSEEAVLAADQLKRVYAADGRVSEFMAFINNVPNAPRMDVSEADQLTFEVAEKEYITQGNVFKLEAYLDEYPDGINRAKALSYLMENATSKGQKQAAYDYATTLVEAYPDNSLALDALVIKAQFEYEQGKGTLALRTWQELEQKASTPYLLNMARLGIARIASEMDNSTEAKRAASAALSSSALSTADRCEALYLRGNAAYRLGDTATARKDWQEGAAYTNDYYGMASGFALAQSYFDTDDFAKAEQLAKALTDADTTYPYWTARGFILLSDVYAAQGNNFKAQQYLKSLKENYPGKEADIFQMIEQRME